MTPAPLGWSSSCMKRNDRRVVLRALLLRLDASWQRVEGWLCAAVIGAEVSALTLWVVLRALSDRARLGAASNVLNWLQTSSSLMLVGGLRGLATRLTLWLALLGASLATSQGKHVHVDVVVRYLPRRLRLPAMIASCLVAAVTCSAAAAGFVDYIGIADFRARSSAPCADNPSRACDTAVRDRLATVKKAMTDDFFLLGRQLSLDGRSLPHLLAGQTYDRWMTAAQWNAWLDGADWTAHFDARAVGALRMEPGGARRIARAAGEQPRDRRQRRRSPRARPQSRLSIRADRARPQVRAADRSRALPTSADRGAGRGGRGGRDSVDRREDRNGHRWTLASGHRPGRRVPRGLLPRHRAPRDAPLRRHGGRRRSALAHSPGRGVPPLAVRGAHRARRALRRQPGHRHHSSLHFRGLRPRRGKDARSPRRRRPHAPRWLPGGLAIVCILASAVFTVLTGGSGVTIIAVGGLLYPALRKQGYSESFSLGLVTTGGSVGLLLPSLPLGVYGIYAHVNLTELFKAVLIPGLFVILLLSFYAAWVATREGVPREPLHLRPMAGALWDLRWELGILAVLAGTMGTGVAALDEAAGAVAFYVVVIQFVVLRDLDWKKDFVRLVTASMTLAGAVILILAMANALMNYVVDQHVPGKVLAFLVGMGIEHRWQILIAMNAFLLLLGMLMEGFSAVLVGIPLVLPFVADLGTRHPDEAMSPFQVAMIFLLNLEIAYCTPPLGLNLFLSSSRFNLPVSNLYRAVLPFVAVLAMGLVAISYVPWSARSPSPETSRPRGPRRRRSTRRPAMRG